MCGRVVVDVVVEVVDDVLTGAATALCGTVDVTAGELPPLFELGATVVVGTDPTVMDCDAAAAAI